MPEAEQLLSFACTSFQCGFTVKEATGAEFCAVLTRTEQADILTVNEKHSQVSFCFQNGEAVLCPGGCSGKDAFCVPVILPEDRGAGAWQKLFSVLPSPDMTAEKTKEGFRVTAPDGYLLITDENQIPLVIQNKTAELHITAFQTLPPS